METTARYGTAPYRVQELYRYRSNTVWELGLFWNGPMSYRTIPFRTAPYCAGLRTYTVRVAIKDCLLDARVSYQNKY
jgi:hypothetical protein